MLRWLRHPWRSWQARRARRLLAFLDRVEAEDQREYLKANGIEDPDEFLRKVSESVSDVKDVIWRDKPGSILVSSRLPRKN